MNAWRPIVVALAVLVPGANPSSPAPFDWRRSESPGSPAAQIRFRDATDEAGISYRNVSGEPAKDYILSTTGSGAGWIDYDRDGRLDLYVTNGARVVDNPEGPGIRPAEGRPNLLFRSLDDGRFAEVEAGVGDRGWAGGCAVADVDNDGFPDLYVTNTGSNRLYRNLGDGTFEAASRPPEAESAWSASAAFTDLDADGFVDLYVTNYIDYDWDEPPAPRCTFLGIPVSCGPKGLIPEPDRVFRNTGEFAFREWPQPGMSPSARFGLGVVPLDIDLDGDMDLYVANDGQVNRLLRNEGGGELRDVGLEMGVAFSGDGEEQAGMGVDAGDVDGDGDPDLFVTNFSHDTNTLYANFSGDVYLDETDARGLAKPSIESLGWATKMVDLDNDGDLDLAVINGHIFPQVDDHDVNTRYRQPPQIFRNHDGRFEPVSGWLDGRDPPPWSGRGAAFADYDDDGDVDLFVVQADDRGVLLVNESPPAPWIGLRLAGRRANRDGLGARVVFRHPDGTESARWSQSAGSYLSSNDPRVRLGHAGSAAPTSAEIHWPGGGVEGVDLAGGPGWLLVVEGRGVVARRPDRDGRAE